jgi:Ca-activated chloride channel homolog
MKFAQPAWLILLVLLPLLGAAAVIMARLRNKQWAAFIAPRLRGALLKRGSSVPRWFALLFLLASCAALILALARPQGDAGTLTEKSLGRNVLIALDLSRSMRVADVKPDRLGRAKMTIYELLEAMPNERFGIIGFAGSAYVYAPLTVDHNAVRETVDQIDETWAPTGGSNLGSAINLAIETLKKTGQKNNALVILSDGEKHDKNLDDMIAQARESGVYILAIGVGTEDGDYVPSADFPGGRMVDKGGKTVVSRLHPEVLRRLATETKGRYAVAGSGADVTSMIQDAIKDLDAFEIEGRERTVAIEFYQWMLFPALVFLLASILAATRWRRVSATALFAAGLFLTPFPARADEVSDAKQTLMKGDNKEAHEAYRKLAEETHVKERKARFRLGEALAAYRAGDFPGTREAYSGALLSGDPAVLGEAHRGMGKTLFQLGWQNIADAPYPENGKAPDMAMFDELVRKKLDEMRGAEESTGGTSAMETLITNWADAVRHFDSALAATPKERSAANSRQVVMTYLKRLGELLEQDRQKTEQSMPQSQKGEGQPQPEQQGEGKPEKNDENGEPQNEGPDQQGNQGNEPDDQPREGQGDEEKSDDKFGKKPDEKDGGKEPRNPSETPEEGARRILKENADLEKGPLTPGRIELNAPEKDW